MFIRSAVADHYYGRMVRRMNATELKAKILAVLDDVAVGEEVEITKHGRVVARLSPARGTHALEGLFTGTAVSVADDDELFSTGTAWEAG